MSTLTRRGTTAAGLALLALVAAGCSSASSSSGSSAPASAPASSASSSPAASTQTITIGLANQQQSVTFPAAIAKGAEAEAAKLGIKLIDLDSQGDQATQANQVQDLISQKVSAILLVPLAAGPDAALANDSAAAGIPIGTVHGFVGTTPSPPYSKLKFVIDENEISAGDVAGQMALKALPQGGQVAVITGAPGFVENTTRVEKFTADLAASTTAKYQVVATQPGGWTKEGGQSACQSILAAHPNIGLVYAISDDMAVGCASAVQAAGSKAKIIGIGGAADGIAAIKAGQMYGTVCYKPYTEGEQAVQMMYDVLTGKTTGAPTTNYYTTPGITAANVNTCTAQW